MDPYQALWNEARDEPPFSNGTEGDGWVYANCGTCWHDREQRNTEILGPGCPLVMVALNGRTPIQWLDGPRDNHGRYSIAGQYHCVEYRHEDDGPAEPQPIPDPPGQMTLAPRADYEGVRMLTQPTPELAVP